MLLKHGVKRFYTTPAQLDFGLYFNEKGLHVFLNVRGFSASELTVNVRDQYIVIKGVTNALSGKMKVNMQMTFHVYFKFDPAHENGFVLKGQSGSFSRTQTKIWFWLSTGCTRFPSSTFRGRRSKLLVNKSNIGKFFKLTKPQIQANDHKHLSTFDDIHGSTYDSIKEFVKQRIMKSYRSPKELEFSTKRSKEDVKLLLNVSGCYAPDLRVHVYGRHVFVHGEGEALSGVKKVRKDVCLPNDFVYQPGNVEGLVHKGQLQLRFPATKQKICLKD